MNADEVKQIFREALTTSFGAPVTEYDWQQLAATITKHVGPHYQRQAIKKLEAELVNKDHKFNVVAQENARLQKLANERVQGYNQLQFAVQDLESRLSAARRRIAEMDKENEEFRRELARLRPPEPKFRVGQVIEVGDCGNFYKISDRKLFNGSGAWLYDIVGCGTRFNNQSEQELRALTDDEK